jgi:hypothetical protein
MRALLVVLAGCGARLADGPPEPTREHPDAPVVADAAPIHLDTTPGDYREVCDGSAAVALDFDHFADFSDSDERVRVFQRGAHTKAITELDITTPLDVGTSVADLEDAARVGDRIYVIGSHARTSDGAQAPSRFRFAALDLVEGELHWAGMQTRLVSDMLDAANWSAPSDAIITALGAATKLDQPTVVNLAPKLDGLSIEGLAYAPTPATPERLAIGLRNPRPNDHAVVVTLMNAAAVIDGAPARFGEAIELDLGGLGILGMTWSNTLHAVLVIAGPHDDTAGPFQLYRWAGTADDMPVRVANLIVPDGAHPEAVIAYPTTTDVQILFDSDNLALYGVPCDQAEVGARVFSDSIVQLQQTTAR